MSRKNEPRKLTRAGTFISTESASSLIPLIQSKTMIDDGKCRASESFRSETAITRTASSNRTLADRGNGECELRDPEIRVMVDLAIRHFSEVRFRLGSYIVMPNHCMR